MGIPERSHDFGEHLDKACFKPVRVLLGHSSSRMPTTALVDSLPVGFLGSEPLDVATRTLAMASSDRRMDVVCFSTSAIS